MMGWVSLVDFVLLCLMTAFILVPLEESIAASLPDCEISFF